MLRELKRESLKSSIKPILLLLIIVVVLLAITDFGALKAVGGAKPLDSLATDALEGQYVETEIYFIYDWYAGKQTTNTATNRSTITEKEYIIPAGDGYFMGVHLEDKMISQADDLMDASQDILFGKTETPGESFTVKGTITRMSTEAVGYYHDVVGYTEWTPEEQAYFLPLVLKVDYLGRTQQGLTWVLTAVAAALVLLAVWMVVASMIGWYQRGIRQFCQQSESPETMLEQLDNFYHTTEPVNGIRIGRFLMFQANGVDTAVSSGDIVWAYQRTVQHSTNGIPSGKSHGLMLRTRDPKKSYEIQMKSESAVNAVLDAMRREYPRMVLGFSPELEKIYNTDLNTFLHLTDPAPAGETPQSGTIYDS